MLYAIDGTGEEAHADYQRDMRHSFIHRLERDYGGIYFRGPTEKDFSISSASIIEAVLKRIKADLKKIEQDSRRAKEELFLAGHSRGGYIALMVAERLTGTAEVKAVFLFDAVKRAFPLLDDASRLSKNIVKCYHAKRDPALSNYVSRSVVLDSEATFINCAGPTFREYVDRDSAPPNGKCAKEWNEMRRLQEEELKYRMAVRSETTLFPFWFRKKYEKNGSINFSNCLEREAITDNPRYEVETFLGTHGAIGGAPIFEREAKAPRGALIAGDAAAMVSVWAWMEPHLATEGLKQVKPAPNALPWLLQGKVSSTGASN